MIRVSVTTCSSRSDLGREIRVQIGVDALTLQKLGRAELYRWTCETETVMSPGCFLRLISQIDEKYSDGEAQSMAGPTVKTATMETIGADNGLPLSALGAMDDSIGDLPLVIAVFGAEKAPDRTWYIWGCHEGCVLQKDVPKGLVAMHYFVPQANMRYRAIADKDVIRALKAQKDAEAVAVAVTGVATALACRESDPVEAIRALTYLDLSVLPEYIRNIAVGAMRSLKTPKATKPDYRKVSVF